MEGVAGGMRKGGDDARDGVRPSASRVTPLSSRMRAPPSALLLMHAMRSAEFKRARFHRDHPVGRASADRALREAVVVEAVAARTHTV